MPHSYQNVPVVETGIPETVVSYQSIDLETTNPAVTLPELNETVPNASLSEDLVSSSTSTTHRYLLSTTIHIEMFSVISPAESSELFAAKVKLTSSEFYPLNHLKLNLAGVNIK